MRKFLLTSTLLLIIVTGLAIAFTKEHTGQQEALAQAQGEAQIGGDFTLTDTSGKTVKDQDFRGRIMLVFFGFTHCPDICPTTLGILSDALQKLGPKAEQVAPIFISVDPERDTPQTIKSYLSNFDAHFIGLTGTPEQVKVAARAYKAYYGKSPDGGSVNHSGFIYMMDKQGKYVQLFPYDAPAQDIAQAVEGQVD